MVTGMGVASSLGTEIDTFWENIITGQCGIDRISAFDVSDYACQIAAEVKNFDPEPAFPNPKEVRRADRFTQLGIFAGWKALGTRVSTWKTPTAKTSAPSSAAASAGWPRRKTSTPS